MQNITFNVSDYVKNVTTKIKQQIIPADVKIFEDLLKDIGLLHLDEFSFLLLYKYHEGYSGEPQDYFSQEENLISYDHILNSWFFRKLSEYLEKIKDDNQAHALEDKLIILNKAFKIFLLSFFDELEEAKMPAEIRSYIKKELQTHVIDAIYVHTKNINLKGVKEIIRKLKEPLGSPRITTDSSIALSMLSEIQLDERKRIVDILLNQLIMDDIISNNLRSDFKSLLMNMGRSDEIIIWTKSDWQLYWLIYFLNIATLINLLPGSDEYDYILNHFVNQDKKNYKRKNLLTHVSQSKGKIENEYDQMNKYFLYHKKLQDIFSTLHLF